MSYAIIRNEKYTKDEMIQLAPHNERFKKKYSNKNIDLSKTSQNYHLKLPKENTYLKEYNRLIKENNLSQGQLHKNSIYVCEVILTSDNTFFNGIGKKETKRYFKECFKFMTEYNGIGKENILTAVVHLDEETPHMHLVYMPVVNAKDKKGNTIRKISASEFWKGKDSYKKLQNQFYKYITEKGFDLERGIKNSDREHIRIKELKKITNSLNKDLGNKHSRLEYELNEFNESLKDKKNILFDKDYVKVKKETFDSMNRVIKEVDDLMDVQDRVEVVLGEVKDQVDSYNTLERKNKNLTNEVKYLKQRNDELEEENKGLKDYIYEIVEKLIEFFRKLLIRGNEDTKDIVTDKVKNIYDENLFNNKDVYKTSVGTERQDELFEYANVPSYMKQPIKSNYRDEIDKDDDFDIGF